MLSVWADYFGCHCALWLVLYHKILMSIEDHRILLFFSLFLTVPGRQNLVNANLFFFFFGASVTFLW